MPELFTEQIELTGFRLPDPSVILADLQRAAWHDFIDFWAVDWDYRGGPFSLCWAAYRTHNNRILPLISAPHSYDARGQRQIAVKVIDVLGNEILKLIEAVG